MTNLLNAGSRALVIATAIAAVGLSAGFAPANAGDFKDKFSFYDDKTKKFDDKKDYKFEDKKDYKYDYKKDYKDLYKDEYKKK